ncbi:FAD-binding domain [Dillenia turbinata]|uniref:FAD-binding domain n=1 Tax=Dillenia turbinata TaxID=194707 RepID=A0AAN8V304_9MAGN
MKVLAFMKKRHNGFFATKSNPFFYVSRRFLSLHPKKFNGEDKLLPVLIVGAGPVGLVLSILLTKLGVKCAVLEKNKAFSKHPQAHFINNRSMEVFRKLDGLAEEIQSSQPPVDSWSKFIYCMSLSGPILGSVDHMQPQDLEQVISPVSVAHFSQYKLVALLLKQVKNLGFNVCSSEGLGGLKQHPMAKEILMGHECISIDASGDFVTATASLMCEGKYMEKKINCRILVGTDGARSTVRRLVGTEMRGERDLQKLVSIHFFSKDLGQYLLSDRPGMLYFIFNTDAIGVLVAHDLQQGEFILQIPFYPPLQNIDDFSPKMCEKLIFKLVGLELEDIDVIDVKPWVMHAEVAEKFVSHDNKVILAGDAAHRFPPAGGFGMNTGIQDAHNLAWKLASLLKGVAPSSIVNSYDIERKQIALSNTELSVKNFRAAMSVPAALGLDPMVANSVHRAISDGIGSILPSQLQRAVLDGIFSIGRAQLSELLLNENNPLGSSRLHNMRRIFEEGKSLQLQFPAEDLGFRYLKGALVPDNATTSPAEAPTGRRRDYVPCAEPGSRLPHMNVRVPSETANEVTISTLDLVSGDEVEFLLIIAPLEKSYALAHSAFKVAERFKVSAKVCIIWPAGTAQEDQVSSKAELTPWENNCIDVVEVERPSKKLSWWKLCQMTERGAILVRPDEHIAWRAKSEIPSDPTLVLEKVFCTVLGMNSTDRKSGQS